MGDHVSMLKSSNPAFGKETIRNGDWWSDAAVAETASISGIINKTGMFAFVLAIAGAGGYATIQANPGLLWPVTLISMVVVFGSFFLIRGSARMARNLGFIYAAFQGFMLGGLAVMFENILASQQIAVPGGIVLQAFLVTAGVLIAMLGLFKAGILTGGPLFTRVVMVATVGVMVAMLLSFVVSLLGVNIPFMNLGAAFGGGSAALIGLGISAALLLLASMWLIIDFRQAEDLVASGAPKEAEWYVAFGLIVTIAWVYLEAMRLIFYLAAFTSRD
jgi:uncharacterized YccA/Bax inhibitor family protein